MKREHINEKINALRGWDFRRCHHVPSHAPKHWHRKDLVSPYNCCGCTWTVPKDWLNDANWPTLMRELREFGSVAIQSTKFCDTTVVRMAKAPSGPSEIWVIVDGDDFGQAVCLAWLKWKGVKI